MDLKRTALDGARREPKADREAIFGIQSVDVAYSGNPAVRDITFDIHMNEITALIGPSGLRQEHPAALPQPDERPDPRRRR